MSRKGSSSHLPVEVEVLEEKASALGRSGERLEGCLARLAALSARIAEADPTERRSLVEPYRAERARAKALRTEGPS